jgi:hypothetical protein
MNNLTAETQRTQRKKIYHVTTDSMYAVPTNQIDIVGTGYIPSANILVWGITWTSA